ncbi:MAG: peptidylprolyl isomerase [Oligoflexales bacterium]|nr:peptidylprolyl isomerase [Oligoflexales bacterium]
MDRFSYAKSQRQHSTFLLKTSIITALQFSSIFLFSTFAVFASELVDRVVATVDGAPILHSEIEKKIKHGPLVILSPFPAKETDPEQSQALQDAINLQLVLRKSQLLELEITDQELETRIEEFLKSNNMNKQQFTEYLAESGQTWDDYRFDYKNLMIVRRFQGRVIQPLINLTQKDVETYYINKSGSAGNLLILDLRQILIEIPEGASEAVKKQKSELVQQIYSKLLGGANFQESLKLYSDEDSPMETRGQMKGVQLSDLAPVLREAVKDVAPGSFSKPIETPVGFHIFLVEKQSFRGGSDFEKNKKAIENELMSVEMARQMQRWIENERVRAKIRILEN